MKTLVTSLVVCLAAAGLAASQNPPVQNPPAQNPAEQSMQQKTAPEVLLTGCLVQGSGPEVFVFEKAKKDPRNEAEVAVKYTVVAGTEDLNLRRHLNHTVRIMGTTDGRIAPATGQKVQEVDLPRLTAKSLTMVSDTCSAPSR